MDIALTLTVFLGIVLYVSSRESYFVVLVCSFSVRFPRFSFQMDIALTQSVLLIFVLFVSSHESCFVVLVCLISACSSVVFNTRESYFVVLDLVCSFSVLFFRRF